MVKLSESAIANATKLLELGMDPEIMAEIVIKAIENDILYVVTHPQFIPMLRARFERIYDDTLKLHDEIEVKSVIKSKVYNNISPAFSVTYPENLVELKPGPLGEVVFVSSSLDINLAIYISKISPKRRLEQTTKKIMRTLNPIAKEIKIISNNLTNLRDGSHAYESVIEFKAAGIMKVKSIHLSVFKDEKWIRVSVFAGLNQYNDEKFKKFLYSLEFK